MRQVWTVHVLKDAGATFAEAVFPDQAQAEAYARARSEDAGVRGTAVTRFTVGELGTRSTTGWFVDGAACDGRALASRSRRKVSVDG
jgi:hypothetical protein